jgi:hypothetical protein
VAHCHGRPVDLHAHFQTGDTGVTRTIEPSPIGAGEVRGAFVQAL